MSKEDLQYDLGRGNQDSSHWQRPTECVERSEDVAAACPYDHPTYIAGAYGGELVGEVSELGRVESAGAGSGKSVSLIGEMILGMFSAICVDPKGEIARASGPYRSEVMQHDVYVLNFGIPSTPDIAPFECSWNPLNSCNIDEDNCLDRIALISDGLIQQIPGTESHWNDGAKSFIEGILILLKLCPLMAGEVHLVKMREIIATGYDHEE